MKALLLAAFLCSTTAFAAAPRANLTGTVLDASGRPLADATVMVYHAGVKVGYSTYCPSCYTDCAKHVLTDARGNFQINDLAGDLWFTLLAARDGFVPVITKSIDPDKIPHITITLAVKPATTDFSGTVRGRVVDTAGSPIANAIITPQGLNVSAKELSAFFPNAGTANSSEEHSMYGTFDGLQPIAVTNPQGDFEIAFNKPTSAMLLEIEARALAPQFAVMKSGTRRQSVALIDGATITGRLIENGKPVPNAQVALIPKNRGGFADHLKMTGDPYEVVSIGTGPDGRFTIPNVPEPVDWYVYATMDSVSKLGATTPLEVRSTHDGECLKLPDLVIASGYRVRGTVQLSDGRPIAEGMHVSISSDVVWDTQTITLASDGHFEFTNLPPGKYQIWASVKGYNEREEQHITVDHDIDNFTTTLNPKAR